jgi:hypothetical protein
MLAGSSFSYSPDTPVGRWHLIVVCCGTAVGGTQQLPAAGAETRGLAEIGARFTREAMLAKGA